MFVTIKELPANPFSEPKIIWVMFVKNFVTPRELEVIKVQDMPYTVCQIEHTFGVGAPRGGEASQSITLFVKKV